MQDELLMGAESVVIKPIDYADYVKAREKGIPLRIELPGIKITIDCQYGMMDAYRTLQGVFCELISHDYRHFLES